MIEFRFEKSILGEENYAAFENLPTDLYPANSFRFKLGNDPVSIHLEGCYLLYKNNEAVGRFAFYKNPDLMFESKLAACIGSYECIEDAETADQLLGYAKQIAIDNGYTQIIGPMEGSTWENYRFSNHNKKPNFFMEPYHHDYYNKQFEAAGFGPISQYLSNLVLQMSYDAERLNKHEKRYKSQGAIFRSINMDNLDEDIAKIAEFSIKAFSNNFLYTPSTTEIFSEKFMKISSMFDPRMILIVEDDQGIIQGFCFSIKDFYDPSGKTLVVKSIARLHDSPYKGIGAFLGGKTTQIAAEAGYERLIHAFFLEDNASRKISESNSGDAFKAYTLYGVQL